VMDGRKRVYGLPITIPKELPLHGFLRCPKCNRSLTGSASRGKQKYHVYYHCTSSCGIRFRAQLVNASFESELSLFAPVQGMAELFAYAIADSHIEQTGGRTSERKALNKQVDEINTKLSRARDLLMDGAIAADDFKEMKSSCLLKLLRIEAKQL